MGPEPFFLAETPKPTWRKTNIINIIRKTRMTLISMNNPHISALPIPNCWTSTKKRQQMVSTGHCGVGLLCWVGARESSNLVMFSPFRAKEIIHFWFKAITTQKVQKLTIWMIPIHLGSGWAPQRWYKEQKTTHANVYCSGAVNVAKHFCQTWSQMVRADSYGNIYLQSFLSSL